LATVRAEVPRLAAISRLFSPLITCKSTLRSVSVSPSAGSDGANTVSKMSTSLKPS
jgi:hypothetical protein